ncbi:hypothetical protein [Pseudoduganella violacea]|uniref:Uncharacterized protein n=1 Tax=Pseudoduganella violacea TaxID=1715466 RepID=A0A7W5BDI9_9BURK|nr:hypothetical protein [Pseudoduganella violacea]MBB3120895.1 hypothetical protein [Pseudoduganella violacea]
MMPESIKAALLSGLIFPGLGQLVFLKRRARGCLFLLPTVASTVYLLYAISFSADNLLQQLNTGHMLSAQMIASAVSKSSTGGPLATMAFLLLPLAWIGSILDALLFGEDHRLDPKKS